MCQGFDGRDGIPGASGLPGPPGNVFIIDVSSFKTKLHSAGIMSLLEQLKIMKKNCILETQDTF